jgi:hypothetical protein
VGGHCIPVYPRFYLEADADARLPAAAREVNLAMPAYAVDLLEEELGPLAGARVVILGVTYRGNVKETAFSGAFALRDTLAARGAEPLVIDPLYDDGELRALGFEPWDGREAAGAVLQADHAAYTALGPSDLPGVRAVVDGRGLLDGARFAAAGVPLRRIGGWWSARGDAAMTRARRGRRRSRARPAVRSARPAPRRCQIDQRSNRRRPSTTRWCRASSRTARLAVGSFLHAARVGGTAPARQRREGDVAQRRSSEVLEPPSHPA